MHVACGTFSQPLSVPCRRPRCVASKAAAGRRPEAPQRHQGQQRARSSVAVPAAATETSTATSSWLHVLNPFSRKVAEPVIPVVSAQQLQLRLQECSEVPLVVVFSAVWCGPCKVMMQRLEKLATQLGPGVVKVVKIDTDESEGGSELATELGVYKLPTIMFCGPQPDKPAVQVQGLVKESVLLDMILHKSKYMGHGLQDSMKW